MLNTLDEVREKIKEIGDFDNAFNYFMTNRVIPNNVANEFFKIYANDDINFNQKDAFKKLYNEVMGG